MIPSTRELAYALYGGWLLLRFDRRGMAYFEDSVEAFWRSFFAAAIVAPAHLIQVALDLTPLETTAGPLRIVLLEALAYAVGWLAFPLALYYLTKVIDKEERFVAAVVALNWSAVWRAAIFLPAIVLAETGILPAGLGGLLVFVAFVFVLVYFGFVALAALETSFPAAAAVVLLDFVLSVLIFGYTEALLV
jgi:hypothetical protein